MFSNCKIAILCKIARFQIVIKTIFSLNTIKYPTSALDISLGYLNGNKKRTSYMTETVESVTNLFRKQFERTQHTITFTDREFA